MPGIANAQKPKKPHHIQIAGKARVIVNAGKHSNRLHIDVTLTRKQETRLLNMLQKREQLKPKRKS